MTVSDGIEYRKREGCYQLLLGLRYKRNHSTSIYIVIYSDMSIFRRAN